MPKTKPRISFFRPIRFAYLCDRVRREYYCRPSSSPADDVVILFSSAARRPEMTQASEECSSDYLCLVEWFVCALRSTCFLVIEPIIYSVERRRDEILIGCSDVRVRQSCRRVIIESQRRSMLHIIIEMKLNSQV